MDNKNIENEIAQEEIETLSEKDLESVTGGTEDVYKGIKVSYIMSYGSHNLQYYANIKAKNAETMVKLNPEKEKYFYGKPAVNAAVNNGYPIRYPI